MNQYDQYIIKTKLIIAYLALHNYQLAIKILATINLYIYDTNIPIELYLIKIHLMFYNIQQQQKSGKK